MNTQNIIAYTLIFSFLIMQSCFKEDDKLDAHQPGDVETNIVKMGQYYSTQSYFDLGTNTNVGSNEKDIWDIAFSSVDSLMHIKLNSAKFMRASNTNDTSFFALNDTTNLQWGLDVSSGNLDSLAIDDWFQISNNDTIFTKNTYVIDLGINALGVLQGIRKLKILSYKDGVYNIQYAKLDNSDFHIVSILKDELYNYAQIELSGNQASMQLEPVKNSWDLFFTQYTDILTTSAGEKYPYLVTGVLLNPNDMEAAITTTLDFDNISIDDIINLEFKKQLDIIGYKWKYYDFDDAIYTVITDQIYIIKDTEGYFYKLRFVGFYNNMGEKGYPQFEFQKL